MNQDIIQYNCSQSDTDKTICDALAEILTSYLPEAEYTIWHAHPVWFLEGNPIVGYSKQKAGIRLLFWSGADFDEPNLLPGTGKFKDASIFYTSVAQVNRTDLQRYLEKAQNIQWDYKNIVKRKGELIRLK